MTTPSTITPPPELVDQWFRAAVSAHEDIAQGVATRAAQWGWDQREPEIQAAADQELEAVVHWLVAGIYGPSIAGHTPCLVADLRAARRPKPPSLKEQALDALGPEPLPETGPTGDAILNIGSIERHRTIRLALEALND